MMTSQLELIKKEMHVWAQMDLWDRVFKSGDMGKAISRHHRDMEALWTRFQVRFPCLWAF